MTEAAPARQARTVQCVAAGGDQYKTKQGARMIGWKLSPEYQEYCARVRAETGYEPEFIVGGGIRIGTEHTEADDDLWRRWPSAVLTPESSAAVLARLEAPASPTPALQALLKGRSFVFRPDTH